MLVFDGAIAGLGSTSGVRLVVGMWLRSPFGVFTDVMVQTADGHRVLVAPTREIADFVAGTYSFDEIRVQPVSLRRTGDRFAVGSADLDLAFELAPRGALGWALTAVPRRWARSRWFATLADPVARLVLRGGADPGQRGRRPPGVVLRERSATSRLGRAAMGVERSGSAGGDRPAGRVRVRFGPAPAQLDSVGHPDRGRNGSDRSAQTVTRARLADNQGRGAVLIQEARGWCS